MDFGKANDELELLLTALVKNSRGNLINIIRKYSSSELSNAQVWNLSIEPKEQLRLRIKDIILKKMKQKERLEITLK